MVGFLLATHGKMAEGMIDSAEMLVGNTDKIEVLSLKPGVDPNVFEKEVTEAIERADKGDGVLALVDIFGGTPNNTIFKVGHHKGKKVKIITGVNLPALVNILSCVDENASLDDVANAVLEMAQDQLKIFG